MSIKQNGDTNTPIVSSVNAQTASYTLVLSDAGKIIEMGGSSTNALTVPTNASAAIPIGTEIQVFQTSTVQCTITAASGVTINATPGLKLRTQWSSAVLRKRGTDTWILNGDLSA